MRTIVLAVTLAVLAGATAEAQSEAPAAAPTVRAHLKDQSSVQGFLRGNSTDELVVYTAERRYVHVPRSALQRLEVRQRTGSHLRRGAVMGVFLWASLMFAASIDTLEAAGPWSWESGAIFAGSVGVGALVGKTVPRYGWVPMEPGQLTGRIDPPPAHVTLRF